MKLERITFELSRLKAYRFGAKTERMDAGQRQMFEEALAESSRCHRRTLTLLARRTPDYWRMSTTKP